MLQIIIRNDVLGMDFMVFPGLTAYYLEPGVYSATEAIVELSGIKMAFVMVANGSAGSVWCCQKSVFEQAIRQGNVVIKESEERLWKRQENAVAVAA